MLSFGHHVPAQRWPIAVSSSCLDSDPLVGVNPAVLGVHLFKAGSARMDAAAVAVVAVLLGVLAIAAALQLVVKLPEHSKNKWNMRCRLLRSSLNTHVSTVRKDYYRPQS